MLSINGAVTFPATPAVKFATFRQWRHWGERSGSDRPGWHHPRSDTQMEVKKLRLNFTRLLEKRSEEWWRWLKRSSIKKSSMTFWGRWLKKVVSFFNEKLGYTISYRTRWVTPTHSEATAFDPIHSSQRWPTSSDHVVA